VAGNAHTVSSPDGRSWSMKTSRQRRSLKESGQVPLLGLHVTVTTILVVVFFFVLKSGTFRILSFLILLAFVLWFVGFVNKLFRTTITADTTGPPADHRMWVAVKRRPRRRYISDLEKAIREGRDAFEPPGLRLEEI
jgi:Ca2+/Na+ antiporter